MTMQLPKYGKGVELTAYQVAEFDGGNFAFFDDFAGSALEDMDLNDSGQVEQTIGILETLISENGIEGTPGTADDSGIVEIPELPLGLYLVSQTGGQEQLLVQSALVPLPYAASDGSGWIYDVVLSPKNSFPGGAAILNKVDDEGNAVGGVQFVLQEKVYPDAPVDGVETETDENGNPLAGATLVVKDEQGNVLSDEDGMPKFGFITNGTPHMLKRLAPGDEVVEGTPTPKTGDDTDYMLYLILMALSAGVCTATLVYRRRKRE